MFFLRNIRHFLFQSLWNPARKIGNTPTAPVRQWTLLRDNGTRHVDAKYHFRDLSFGRIALNTRHIVSNPSMKIP